MDKFEENLTHQIVGTKYQQKKFIKLLKILKFIKNKKISMVRGLKVKEFQMLISRYLLKFMSKLSSSNRKMQAKKIE